MTRKETVEDGMSEDTIIQFSEAPMSTESVFNELVKIQSWPSVAIVFAMIIIFGYCLRFWKTFPNAAIPLVIIIMGAGFMMLLSDAAPTGIPARIWHVKNALTGIIIGFISWLAHNQILSRLEDKLATKFDFLNNALGNKTQTRTQEIAYPQAPTDPKV